MVANQFDNHIWFACSSVLLGIYLLRSPITNHYYVILSLCGVLFYVYIHKSFLLKKMNSAVFPGISHIHTLNFHSVTTISLWLFFAMIFNQKLNMIGRVQIVKTALLLWTWQFIHWIVETNLRTKMLRKISQMDLLFIA